MKFAPALKPFRFKRKARKRLIFEGNGFSLKAAIAEITDEDVTIIDFATSTAPNVDQAIEIVLTELKSRDPKIPRECSLISSQAAASILELPLNPQAPFKREEVQELVRWEFEQQLAEQTASLTLDTILVGRKLLTEAEIDEAREALLAETSGSISITSAPSKFADQVVKMGFVERSDVEDCIRMLEAYYIQEDEPICNFFPLAAEGDGPGDSGFPWLICGIGQTAQQQWVNRFDAHDLRLDRIYPTGFVSCAAFDPPKDNQRYGILDLLEGVDCYVSYSGVQLSTLRWGPAPLSARNPEALVNLVGADRIDCLWLSGESRIIKPVAEAITQELRVHVRTFCRPKTGPMVNGSATNVRLDGIHGALRHQESLETRTLPWIEGAGPGPPWWKQATKWWLVIGITLTLLIIASEVSLAIRRSSVQWALDQITGQVESVKGEITKAEGASKQAQNLQESIKKTEESLRIKKAALSLISEGLDNRSRYTKELFLALARSVTPSVAVNEFREERDHSINLEAWAVTEKESQEFIRSLVEKLSPWGLTLSLQQVRLKPGRLGLPGYIIQLQLSANPDFQEHPSFIK